MSRGTRDTNLASDTEAEYTAEGKISEHPPGCFVQIQSERNPQENEGLKLLVRVKF